MKPVKETKQKGAFSAAQKESRMPFFSPFIQPELIINQPNDVYEQEANMVANRVTQMPSESGDKLPFFTPSALSAVNRKYMSGAQKNVSRKESSGATPAATNTVKQSLQSTGEKMDKPTLDFMESRFGHDFGNVEIHNDNLAHRSSADINAKAYTHQDHVVFGAGQYQPGTGTGKHLLAHELTHVVQQKNGLQRQPDDDVTGNSSLNITDEMLDIPLENGDASSDTATASSAAGAVAQNTTDEDSESAIQRQPVIQKDDAPAPPRSDLVFIMGTSGGFYLAAKKFFSQHYPSAEIVDFKDRSLAGIFDVLRSKVSASAPAGNIYIVSHANQDGTLSFPLNAKDKDKHLTFGELRKELSSNVGAFKLNGGVDDKTSIHIKGCNIGRNADMLNALDEAFGGQDKVDAPTHKQGYEYHSEKKDGKNVTVSSEFFNTPLVEYPGSVTKETDTLVTDFKTKYSDELAYTDDEWKMLVIGATKFKATADKEGRDEKATVDEDAKEKKKDTDKSDKAGLHAIDADAKTAKTAIDDQTKKRKASKVAGKSPGVKRKVDNKFTVTLYNGVDPSLAPEKIKPPLLSSMFNADDLKKFSIIKCTSVTPAADNPLVNIFAFEVKDKKTGDINTATLSVEIPKTSEDESSVADKMVDETVKKNPEYEVPRRDMYSWRTEKKSQAGKLTLTAFLEMTQYMVDVDLREEDGEKVDPDAKKNDDFYYGNSDFQNP